MLVVIGICISGLLHAQDDKPRQYHQIFLKDTVELLKNVEYDSDSLPSLQYELSPDKTTIYLYNYDGKHRIKLTYRSTGGTPQSFSKSSCNVHYLPEL